MAKKRTLKTEAFEVKRKGDADEWLIEVAGSHRLHVTLPSSITLQGRDDLSVEDLLALIANYLAAKKGTVISPNCCSRRAMMA